MHHRIFPREMIAQEGTVPRIVADSVSKFEILTSFSCEAAWAFSAFASSDRNSSSLGLSGLTTCCLLLDDDVSVPATLAADGVATSAMTALERVTTEID